MDKHVLATCLTFSLLAVAAVLGSQLLATIGIVSSVGVVMTEHY